MPIRFPLPVAAVLLLPLLPACSPTGDPDDDDLTVPPSEEPLQLSLPVLEAERIALPVVGFDHDPEDHDGAYQLLCADYEGRAFPHCYDGHDGSDFLLDGGFEAMDEGGSATVIAAAEGTVVAVEDGHYDHCHGDLATLDVDCDGHEMIGNSVILEHTSGMRSLYWHFMTDSILVVEGDDVDEGTPLGLMGSSGRSSQPHLHFEIQDPDGESVDSYAGPYSQEQSFWCDQGHPDGLPGTCAGSAARN